MKQLNETQWQRIKWGSIGAGLLLALGFSFTLNAAGPEYGWRYVVAWLLFSGAVFCVGLGVYTTYRSDWPRLTDNQGGRFPFILSWIVILCLTTGLIFAWRLLRP